MIDVPLPILPRGPFGVVCHPSAYESVLKLLQDPEKSVSPGARLPMSHVPVAIDPIMLPDAVELHYDWSSWKTRLDEIKNRNNTGREDDE